MVSKEIQVKPEQRGKIQPPIQQNPLQEKGFRKIKQRFPKLGISGLQAKTMICLADGQPLAAHSKKNLERHFLWVQNNFMQEAKSASDLRSDITRYEKKFGKLKPEKTEKVKKALPKGFAPRYAPKKNVE